jgi:hypothetical protein
LAQPVFKSPAGLFVQERDLYGLIHSLYGRNTNASESWPGALISKLENEKKPVINTGLMAAIRVSVIKMYSVFIMYSFLNYHKW